jgi:hypothetical protein
LFLDAGEQLSFPNHVHLSIAFNANPGLGGIAPPGQTAAAAAKTTLRWDANIGRSTVHSDPPLPELNLAVSWGPYDLRLQGQNLTVDFDSQTRDGLLSALWTFHYLLPILLSLDFLDAPTVATTSGTVGDAPFTWQVARTEGLFETTNSARQAEKFRRALDRMASVNGDSNRPLLASLAYFQRGVRLAATGDAAYEFAGEVILNLAKCLQALFPPEAGLSREPVRKGLTRLGLSSEDIETWFVPCLLLRDTLDVAHIRFTSLTADQLRTLQVYSERALGHFRDMLRTVMDSNSEGTFELAPYLDEGPDAQTENTVKILAEHLGLAGDPVG